MEACLSLLTRGQVTNTPFENLVIQDNEKPDTAFPFRALLEFVEASCEHQLQGLVILDSEELLTYKTKLVQSVHESYSKHYDDLVRERDAPHLHNRIAQLQAELSEIYASLKEQQTELASLRSAQSKQILGAYEKTNDTDTESDTVIKVIPKRRRLSRRPNHFGMDGGADEQTMDDQSQDWEKTSDWPHSDASSSHSRSQQQTVSAPYSPRDPQSIRSMSRSRRTLRRLAANTMSPRGSGLNEFGTDPSAAYGTSAFDELLMPPPSQPRAYAPGLAMRKPKTDEYDPLGRLIPQDLYPLQKDKEDTVVTGTWTTIDTEFNQRNWDALGQQERSESRSYDSSSSRGVSDVYPRRVLRDRDITSSVAHSNETATNLGSTTLHGKVENLVDSRFEDPELDIDPEIRVSNSVLSSACEPCTDIALSQSRFRHVTELLQPQTAPRSAFEGRNKDALSRNTAAAVKVIIGGQVAKTLDRKVDNRGELRDRHGKYIDGKNRGLMKKHLEEDRKRFIEERDEQLVRATHEKRAWDAMDPSEKEKRLAKKAKNNFLVRMLGAGMGGTDMCETEDIPVRQTELVLCSPSAVS